MSARTSTFRAELAHLTAFFVSPLNIVNHDQQVELCLINLQRPPTKNLGTKQKEGYKIKAASFLRGKATIQCK
jgi:hypothetical protein